MAARSVDPRKTRKAMAKVRRVAEALREENGVGMTAWEEEFAESLEARLETYGSAFADRAKGPLDEALSMRQTAMLRLLAKKARRARRHAESTSDQQPGAPKDQSVQRRSSLRRGKAAWGQRGKR